MRSSSKPTPHEQQIRAFRSAFMAVDATHPNQAVPFSWPSVPRFVVNPYNQAVNVQQMRFSGIQSGTSTLPVNYPCYQPAALCDSIPAKTSVNTIESGLTYNFPAVPRKRSRDSMNQFHAPSNFPASQKSNGDESQFSSLFGDDLSAQIQRQQLEIDTIISQHSRRMRLELRERQTQQAKFLTAAIGEGAVMRLREKDEQIQKVGKLNLALQERVRSLFMENQLWRDLAQTNEAQANSLRSDLEQVLLAHTGNQDHVAGAAPGQDDVESCCGSNDDVGGGSCYGGRSCKRCGERESSVLLLPCRHLCLCDVCGSGSHHIQACPICDSVTNATLHVNMSP